MLQDCVAEALALMVLGDGYVGDDKVPAAVADNSTHSHSLSDIIVFLWYVHDVAAIPGALDRGSSLGGAWRREAGGRAEMQIRLYGGHAGVDGVAWREERHFMEF